MNKHNILLLLAEGKYTKTQIFRTKVFKVGDFICHENNYKIGLNMWGIADEDDVANYSGKNSYYYVYKDNTEGQIN